MSFESDLDSDLDDVFFDDFGAPVLLNRVKDPSDNPIDIRCIISRGLDRFVGGGYLKNSWEIEFKTIDRVSTGDQIQIINVNGSVIKNYLIGDQADRTGDTVTFAAKVDK
jgi:hypothetical protein